MFFQFDAGLFTSTRHLKTGLELQSFLILTDDSFTFDYDIQNERNIRFMGDHRITLVS